MMMMEVRAERMNFVFETMMLLLSEMIRFWIFVALRTKFQQWLKVLRSALTFSFKM